MRVAICLSGEVRTFLHPLVRDGWKRYIEPLNASLFISVWQHLGVSYYTKNFSLADPQEEYPNLLGELKESYCNIKDIELEDYNKWFATLPDDLAHFLVTYRECASSAPQLYKIFKADLLRRLYEVENNFKYDIVIRLRPDFLAINPFDFSNFKDDTVFNINFGVPGAFSKNRIYDIIFYGGSKEMTKLCGAWSNYINLLRDPFENGLGKNDCCRLLYIQAQKQGLNIENVSHRIGDIYRDGTLDEFKTGLSGWGLTP